MKFFPREHDGGIENIPRWKQQRSDYADHLRRLAEHLPEELIELAELEGVEDAVLIEAEPVDRNYRLMFRCPAHGSFRLEITFIEAEVTSESEALIAKIAAATAEVVRQEEIDNCSRWKPYDVKHTELDMNGEGMLEYRCLFHVNFESDDPNCDGFEEFAISCRQIEWRELPMGSPRKTERPRE